jgi:hypothetical protein
MWAHTHTHMQVFLEVADLDSPHRSDYQFFGHGETYEICILNVYKNVSWDTSRETLQKKQYIITKALNIYIFFLSVFLSFSTVSFFLYIYLFLTTPQAFVGMEMLLSVSALFRFYSQVSR